MSRHSRVVVSVVCALCLLSGIRLNAGEKQLSDVKTNAGARDAEAASAFEAIVKVLRHPRCMNCHSSGDFPRQGDDEHRHTMNVRRGPAGMGVAGVKCSTCHQDHNTQGEHTPPGAPGWELPLPRMPMIWEGLSDRQLCELFKDPAQNGGRNLDEIVKHMQTPLVLWGWHPGGDRTPIPASQSEFIQNVKAWASKGGACPNDGVNASGR
jgi:hypothetical protein